MSAPIEPIFRYGDMFRAVGGASCDDETGDCFVMLHHNGLVLVGLGFDHPLVESGEDVRVSFDAADKVVIKDGSKRLDLSDMAILGKKKRGRVMAKKNDVFCVITDSRDRIWTIRVPTNDLAVLEVNTNHANLCTLEPKDRGWLAIFSSSHPSIDIHDTISCLSKW